MFKIVKKELVCHIANWLVYLLILQLIIICSVCSFFTLSYIRVFHRLKRNIFMGNSIKAAFVILELGLKIHGFTLKEKFAG